MAKGYYPNWSEEVLVIKKVKSAVPWTYVISDLKGEKVVRTFQEKKKEKTNKKEFRAEKVLKEKARNYVLNGKTTMTLLTVGLIKETWYT